LNKLRHISIKQRIYWSFFLLVMLFVASVVVTNVTLNANRRLSEGLTEVVNPSIQGFDDFKKMLLESKMYTTNWVFLRYNEEDKLRLEQLHSVEYPDLKRRLLGYSKKWVTQKSKDSLNRIFIEFDELLAIEKNIMQSLQSFEDYDDAVTKLEAERKVEEEILPRTAEVMSLVNLAHKTGLRVRNKQSLVVDKSSMQLRMVIAILMVTIIGTGVILAIYLTKVIVAPVNRISKIINDLGKGITRKIDYSANRDEISIMVRSVNNLSDKLQRTASFAREVGFRNFEVPFEPLSDEDTLGKALLAMRENILKGEITLENKNKELERKNKELEQFAYVASHDLQEPLRTVSSFAELFQKQYRDKVDEKGTKYLDYILQSSSRMKVLIMDLLEYSRIGSKKQWEQVDCNKVVAEVLADLDVAVREAGAEIKPGVLPVITAYPTEIKQLFQNLVFNAIKFRKKNTAPRIEIDAKRNGEFWEFSVADNGIGIAPEHHDRIFIIFQRLHNRNEYQGSGIGLSHCKKIVELHKGRIWLKSEPDLGTTFYFNLQYNHA
jgi:signal transduction histidine kinase